MNIFELLLHDPRQQQSLSSLQHQWSMFLSHISSLESAIPQAYQQILSRGSSLWTLIQSQSQQVSGMFFQHYEFYLKGEVNGRILRQLQALMQNGRNSLVQMTSIAHKFYIAHHPYIRLIDNQSNSLQHSLTQTLQKVLKKVNLPEKFNTTFQHTFHKHCMGIFAEDIIDFDENIKEYLTGVCEGVRESAIDYEELKIVISQLSQMQVFESIFQEVHLFLIKDCNNFLTSCSDLQSSSRFLTNTINYHNVFIKAFIKKLTTEHSSQFLTQQMQLIQESIYFLAAKFCSQNILQIVLDYPDSHSVILVLKKCLDRSGLLTELSEHLLNGIKKRLLIPGVITQNILNQYLNMLRVLQIIDPHGMVFDKITQPIKNYLLKRNDTLRCIISHMTQNGEISSGLTRDMIRIPSKQYIDEQSSDQNEGQAEQWHILNIKEKNLKIRVKYQQIDLATVLVNLYGSQQAFITQYQNMLAQKLMSVRSYNIEEQIKNIQLLKMRFGENALQNCNVIVKDIRDSKKNDTVIHKEKASKNQQPPTSNQLTIDKMNCLAVSKGYWPINYDNPNPITFNLPQKIKSVFNEYSEQFSKLKAMRKIHYHNSLGHVDLTLSFENGDFEFKCLPIHAVMIGYFDEETFKDSHNGISCQDLGKLLNVSQNVVKQKMSFWVHMGVVKEIRPQQKAGLSLRRLNSIQQQQTVYYKPVEHYTTIPRDQMQEDVDEFISKQNSSMESHLKHIIQGLIISILNTNGPKSHEKIHLLLKTVYKTDLDYAYQQTQTIQILKKMVQKKKILFNGQLYSKLAK